MTRLLSNPTATESTQLPKRIWGLPLSLFAASILCDCLVWPAGGFGPCGPGSGMALILSLAAVGCFVAALILSVTGAISYFIHKTR